jgi:mRNA interferase MazF
VEITLRRGDIVPARLNPNKGAEMGKVRPVIILTQSELIKAGLPMVMVLPLTSQFWPALSALRVEIAPRERLLKQSYAVLEQARSIDISRIQADVLTRLTPSEFQKIEAQLKLLLGFD